MPREIQLPRADRSLEAYRPRASTPWSIPSAPIRSRIAYAAAHVVSDPAVRLRSARRRRDRLGRDARLSSSSLALRPRGRRSDGHGAARNGARVGARRRSSFGDRSPKRERPAAPWRVEPGPIISHPTTRNHLEDVENAYADPGLLRRGAGRTRHSHGEPRARTCRALAGRLRVACTGRSCDRCANP